MNFIENSENMNEKSINLLTNISDIKENIIATNPFVATYSNILTNDECLDTTLNRDNDWHHYSLLIKMHCHLYYLNFVP